MSETLEQEVAAINADEAAATSTSGASAPASTKNVSAETKTYRTYGITQTGEKGEIEFKAYGEKNPDGTRKILANPLYRQQTADGKSWTSAEETGNTKLSENNYTFYTLENLEGFEELVPDAEQRLYIVQKGVQALQIQKANALQAQLNEDGTEFAFDLATIDLREHINAAPKRQSLTGVQKVASQLAGLSAADQAKLMEMLLAMQTGA